MSFRYEALFTMTAVTKMQKIDRIMTLKRKGERQQLIVPLEV